MKQKDDSNQVQWASNIPRVQLPNSTFYKLEKLKENIPDIVKKELKRPPLPKLSYIGIQKQVRSRQNYLHMINNPNNEKEELSLVYERFPLQNQILTQGNFSRIENQNVVTGNKLPIYKSHSRTKISKIKRKNLL